jgi:hypothetical protein
MYYFHCNCTFHISDRCVLGVHLLWALEGGKVQLFKLPLYHVPIIMTSHKLGIGGVLFSQDNCHTLDYNSM